MRMLNSRDKLLLSEFRLLSSVSFLLRCNAAKRYLTAFCLLSSVFCLLSFPETASGATYYVDDANGNDSNPGTETQPWKTLGRAYTWYSGSGSKVAEGDTVYFKNGNYGQFMESAGGNPPEGGVGYLFYRNDWITYKAATGHSPTFSGIYILGEDKWGEIEHGRNYLIFEGFNIQNGASFNYTSYIQVKDCNITATGLPYEGLYAPYYDKDQRTVKIDGCHYVTIENSEISYGTRTISISSFDNITVKNNTIHKFAEDGIGNTASQVTIENNHIYDCEKRRTEYYITGTQSGTFEIGETINQEGTNATGVVYKLPVTGSLRFFLTNENWFAKAPTGGTVTGETSGATLSDISYLDGSHCDGIQMHTTFLSDINIVNNIIHGGMWNGIKIASYKNGDVNNITVANNLVYDTDDYAILMGSEQGEPYATVHHINFYNNTFYARKFAINDGFEVENLYNNIITLLMFKSPALGVTNHGNNIFREDPQSGPPSNPFAMNETEIVETSPGFVDAANGNFNLVPSSVAINFGNSNYGPATDILGHSRVGAPDAGAYEYIPPDSNNHDPNLAAIGNKSVNENALLTFTVSATDADSDTITYSDQNLPTGATFSSQTFNWTPTYAQAGTYRVTFIAGDGQSQDSETITITVNNVNQPPVLAAIGDKSVNENALLTFTVSATDADSDTITYSDQNLPSGATFSNQTFNWTPTYTQTGTYRVTFIAGDGQSQDSETITITVGNVNQPPAIAAIGDKSVNENTALSFSVSATDADGDAITYSVDDLPSGAAFASQSFSWTPTYSQAGTHQVTFTAGDGQSQDSETITITVNNVNRPPVLGSIGNKSVYVNDLLTFTVSGTDPDGDPIEYSASGLPAGATFAGQNFSWTPTDAQTGSHQVTFVAGDGQSQDSETITITVLGTDTSPPVVANYSPAANSIQVPLNSLVILHITDAGRGVDANTAVITVNGDVIYSGNTSSYSSTYGNCRRSGTKADYTYMYQPNSMFDFDQTVAVTVNAADLAGNVMSQRSYSFTTEMRSFGQNKLVGSGSDTLSESAPATVRDSVGNIWVVWQAGSAGSRDIYIGKRTAGADDFGSSTRLTQSTADQCNPAIAIDSTNKLYVVWQDNRSGNWDIYVSTSSGGATWTAEQRVTDINDNEISPAIAVDNLNRAYIAWQDDRNGNQDIYIAVSSNGFAAETVSQITSNSADQTEPAIAVDSSNTVYAVWTDARNSSSDIYGAASSSGPWTNVPIVNTTGNQSSPAIAAGPEGSILYLVWVDDRSGNQDIYYATSNGLPGSPLSGGSIIDDTSSANQLAPVIITNSSSNVFACWQDRRNITVSGGDTDLYFAELTSGSGTNVLVGDDGTNSDQSEPAISIGEYGHPYLVWTDGRSANTEIYYAASTFVEPVALNAKDVSASAGATVGTEPASITKVDDVSIVVPAGACSCDVKISISKIKNPQAFTTPCLGSYDFGPSGMQFSQPVTVTIPYAVSSTDTSALPYWYNSLTGSLSQQGITDVENIQISSTLYAIRFKTTHFTPFYLLGGGSGDDGGDDGDDGGDDDDSDGGGGGGGGGGCSLSTTGEANFAEFLLPYVGLAIVMVVLKLRDRRNRKARRISESKG